MKKNSQPKAKTIKSRHIDDPNLAGLMSDVRDIIFDDPYLDCSKIARVIAPICFGIESFDPSSISSLMKSGRIAPCSETLFVPTLAAAYFPPPDVHLYEMDYNYRFRADPVAAKRFLSKLREVAEYTFVDRPKLLKIKSFPKLWDCTTFTVTVDEAQVFDLWFNPPPTVNPPPSITDDYTRLMAKTIELWRHNTQIINKIIRMGIEETGRSPIAQKYKYNIDGAKQIPPAFEYPDFGISEDSLMESLFTLYANFTIPHPKAELVSLLKNLADFYIRYRCRWDLSMAAGAVKVDIEIDFAKLEEYWGELSSYSRKRQLMMSA